jgi:hypothetical protein
VGFRDQGYIDIMHTEKCLEFQAMRRGPLCSREQYVRQQPLCGEVRQDSSKHGEHSAGLLHQLAKQGLELSEESGELGPEINGLGSGGNDMGIGGRFGGGTGG